MVCTLTPSREPVVEGAWFRPGQHVNAVGAPPRPDHREIDSAGMARARVFVDSRGTAMHESGDLLLAIAEGAIAAAEVVVRRSATSSPASRLAAHPRRDHPLQFGRDRDARRRDRRLILAKARETGAGVADRSRGIDWHKEILDMATSLRAT